jgi:DNA modification methylase
MNRLFTQMLNTVTCGECIDVMAHLPARSIDFVLTDPPYLVNYRDRSGRRVANDDNADWLKPAFAQIHRVLKADSLCVSFYGWDKVDLFMAAWRAAGFRPVGQIIFRKTYASSTRYLSYRHEGAYLLAKGFPPFPDRPPPDVIDWQYTANKLHPTQKPVQSLKPLIAAFTKPGAIILDPFAGSGSTLVAAHELGRKYIGIDLDAAHHRTARQRLAGLIAEAA